MDTQMDMDYRPPTVNAPGVTLAYWRDIEILSPPEVPRAGTAEHTPERALPWQLSQRPPRNRSCVHEYVVYLGVDSIQNWVRAVLKASGAGDRLSEAEGQSLRDGRAWAAMFRVNALGEVIPGSYVPASFALGVERLRAGKSLDGLQADIDAAAQAFESRCVAHLAALPTERGDAARAADKANPVNARLLAEEQARALKPFEGDLEGSAHALHWRQYERNPRRRADDTEAMNSFFLGDLDRLIRRLDEKAPFGRALTQYLGPPAPAHERQDMLRLPLNMRESLSPAHWAPARWPGHHPLQMDQQAAVNEIWALNPSAGLVSVNGPPGTGKTTLLRDVVANVVVQRAKALAALSGPHDAFGAQMIIGGRPFHPVKGAIVDGTGIVVASANNAAVENITRELPLRESIDVDAFPNAAYLPEVAAAVLAATQERDSPRRDAPGETELQTWGLISAVLGNQDNRWRFGSAFFRYTSSEEFTPGTSCDLKTRLRAALGRDTKAWHDAKRLFRIRLEIAEKARRDRAEIEQALGEVPTLRRTAEGLAQQRDANEQQQREERQKREAALSHAAARIDEAEALVDSEKDEIYGLKAEIDGIEQALEIVRNEKLGILVRLLAKFHIYLRAYRDWLDRTEKLEIQLKRAGDGLKDAQEIHKRAEQDLRVRRKEYHRVDSETNGRIAEIETWGETIERDRCDAESRLSRWEQSIELARAQMTLPDDAFFSQSKEARHLSSPWDDALYAEARAELFLAALKLHEETLLCNAQAAMKGLEVAVKMLANQSDEPISSSHLPMVWNLLFFAVPVVSTTLASMARVFQGMKAESLGWLLVDEAGQAPPQQVAGALWRARRAVIIGDPMQVEPVVTVPTALMARLRERHGADLVFSTGSASAQTVADRTMRKGAYLGAPGVDGDAEAWTGLPLRVHWRCAEPMFGVANDLAYGGQMVLGRNPKASLDTVLGPSCWHDVRGSSAKRQLVPQEMEKLAQLLDQLRVQWPLHADGEPASLFVISPFKAVARGCQEVLGQHGLKHISAGTIHTFQGKEADIVILVLGTAPGGEGAGSRRWVVRSPNILNVALTRAKQRIHVIGNAKDWGREHSLNRLWSALSAQRVAPARDA